MATQRPRIYGDRLMVLLEKADKEMQMIDDVFSDRDDIFDLMYDSQIAEEAQQKLDYVYRRLEADDIRGQNALAWLSREVIDKSPYDELLLRMAQSDEFPEVKKLMVVVEEEG